MKHTNILAIALTATSCLGYKRFDGEQVFRITDRSFDIKNLETILGDDVDVWSYKRGAVDVRIPKHQIAIKMFVHAVTEVLLSRAILITSIAVQNVMLVTNW